MLDFKEMIEKIKDILAADINRNIKDIDVSNILNISAGNLKQRKARNKAPYWEIMQFLASKRISINYFFFGQTPESIIEYTDKYVLLKYNKNISASGGVGAINHETFDKIVVDKKMLDFIGSGYKYMNVISVIGDSMEPIIPDGSLLFVDTASEAKISNNKIYVVHTETGTVVKKY
jgi:SOS-response transcriptional repressor LexA